ncbi:MAG: general secretion pathway protein GspK [Phycisphaerales bacterium]|nr:general secretion pathway protein GspK [Phycisphaerales bacterium]
MPVGGGYYWLLKPNFDDEQTPAYGLIDEAGKVHVSHADLDMLMGLPNMTADLAAGILDWWDEDEVVQAGGAESAWYQLSNPPYYAKNDRMETVEELLLVKDITSELLFGEDTNRNGVLDANEDDGDASEPADNRDGLLDRGLFPFVTVYTTEPVSIGRRTRMVRGRINLNSAPWQVLVCLPGLTEADAKAIVAHRQSVGEFGSVEVLADILSPDKVGPILSQVTISSYRCMADIVAVDGQGRSFVRYQVVFDIGSNPPRVLHVRDLTSLGWPLDPALLTDLRQGRGIDGTLTTGVVAMPSIAQGGSR